MRLSIAIGLLLGACSSSPSLPPGADLSMVPLVDLAGGDLEGADFTAQTGPMTFFITSTGNGAMGGNFGGLTGADGKCQSLAGAVGSTRTWRAYLSTSTVNARDRIGAGPWFNQRGFKIADSVAALHQCTVGAAPGGQDLCAPFPYQEALDEHGVIVPPTEHDALTGSDQTGAAVADTCQSWTSNASTDFGQVGHTDAADTGNVTHNVVVYIWSGAHVTQGCNLAGLMATGGVGRLYCFAIN